jgi:hypothetical protein
VCFSCQAGAARLLLWGETHDHGDKALKVLGVYVVDKTKPLASPVSQARTIWRQASRIVLHQGPGGESLRRRLLIFLLRQFERG